MTGSSDEWIKVSKAGGRDSRVSTASGERRSMSREDEGGRKYSRDLCDNRDLRDESDESLAETEVYVSDENRWRKASEVFPDHPGDANGRRSRALSERRESGDIRQSLSRKSGFGDGDVNRPSVANRKSYADQGDRQSVSYRKSYASRDDEGDARRSVASRKSYTDDGGDRLERRSTRKSTFEDAGDAHRASRKSYADVEDGDLRRSVMRKSEVDLGCDEEGGDVRRATRKSDVREEEGDNLRRSGRMSYASEGPIARQSVANRKSYASIQDSDLRRSVAARASYDLGRDDEGDARRSVVTRKSNREEEIDLNRRSLSRKSYAEEGPRASRAERRSHLEGAEQRKLSQPPEDSESDILMQDGFRRKSEVRGPKARQMLALELDADSPSEMKSIVWKFTERGACVKVLNKDCPEASPEMLRAGDLLALINDECVLDQPKAFIQKTWKEQQLEDRFVTLRFKPLDYEV